MKPPKTRGELVDRMAAALERKGLAFVAHPDNADCAYIRAAFSIPTQIDHAKVVAAQLKIKSRPRSADDDAWYEKIVAAYEDKHDGMPMPAPPWFDGVVAVTFDGSSSIWDDDQGAAMALASLPELGLYAAPCDIEVGTKAKVTVALLTPGNGQEEPPRMGDKGKERQIWAARFALADDDGNDEQVVIASEDAALVAKILGVPSITSIKRGASESITLEL